MADTMTKPRISLEPGDILTVQLDSGIDISVCWRATDNDFRVTVLDCYAHHVETPRHFADQEIARQHARGLVVSYRGTGEQITVNHVRRGQLIGTPPVAPTLHDLERLGAATRALAFLDGHLVAGDPDGVCTCGAYLVGDHHGDVCTECVDLDTDGRRQCRAANRHTACGPIGDPAQCDHLRCGVAAGPGQHHECSSGADLCCGCCHDEQG